MNSWKSIFTLIVLFSLTCSVAHAKVAVSPMFSDQMVLQQAMAVPVWGTADAGEKVTVAFRDQTKTTTAAEDGKWQVKLDALKLGDAAELSVTGKDNEVRFKDVLVGEVWLGSGQSNMAGRTGGYAKNDPVLAKNVADGPYPKLRLYSRSGWKTADEKTMNGFSAIHLSFGLALHKELKVPVGLIVGAVGGTPSGRWLSEEMAAADPALVARLKRKEGVTVAGLKELREKNMVKWQAEAKKLKAEGKRAPRFPGPIQVGDLYARHIEYIVPYGIRGVLWDQGESRVQIPGIDQFTAMHALIGGWRSVWGRGDFPFLHVQKPSGGGCAWDPENPVNRGALKFAPNLPGTHLSPPSALAYPLVHIRLQTIKNAPLVTASDLGTGIHPANKSGYGQRACRVALGTVYDHDVATCGPVYKSHVVEGNKVRVSFDHVGAGLAFRHADTVRGFEIAGKDGKWAWADAEIDGDTIVLSSKEVINPVNVQYAFRQNSNYSNLFNKDGLPALTFTTVKWEE